jgi:hypothetical protein
MIVYERFTFLCSYQLLRYLGNLEGKGKSVWGGLEVGNLADQMKHVEVYMYSITFLSVRCFL